MNDIWCAVFIVSITVVGMLYMVIIDIRTARRRAPDGKVFVRNFIKIITDIYDASRYRGYKGYDSSIVIYLKDTIFKVLIEKELPYEGLVYTTIPAYTSYAIYINSEIVCRVHRIDCNDKKHSFIEFSAKRKRDEVIDILKGAQKVANEYNNENITSLYSKYNGKSFYAEDKK